MKKLLLSLAACATLGMSMHASADDHTVTLGYAQSRLPTDMGNKMLKGANLKYRYEWDSPISFITSFTYMGGNINDTEKDLSGNIDNSADTKLRDMSIAAGPAYRFNEFISIYALAGVNFLKMDHTTKNYDMGKEITRDKEKTTTGSFLYGAGVQINPTANLTFDLGYEGTQIKFDDNDKIKLNGLNLGVGYRF